MPTPVPVERDIYAKRIIRGYYLAFALLFVSFLLTFITNNRLSSHAKDVDATNRIITNLKSLFVEVTSAESAFRGYIIIHDEMFLKPYHGSFSRADSIFKELNNEADGTGKYARPP